MCLLTAGLAVVFFYMFYGLHLRAGNAAQADMSSIAAESTTLDINSEQRRRINTIGWGENKGTARVPIGLAMDLVLEDLQASQADPPPPSIPIEKNDLDEAAASRAVVDLGAEQAAGREQGG